MVTENLAVSLLRLLAAGFPPRRIWFKPGSGHVGFVAENVKLGLVLSKYFGFPCQSIHRLFPLSEACTINQIVADIPFGLNLTLLQENLEIKPKMLFFWSINLTITFVAIRRQIEGGRGRCRTNLERERAAVSVCTTAPPCVSSSWQCVIRSRLASSSWLASVVCVCKWKIISTPLTLCSFGFPFIPPTTHSVFYTSVLVPFRRCTVARFYPVWISILQQFLHQVLPTTTVPLPLYVYTYWFI
jgi:hypothetical protein